MRRARVVAAVLIGAVLALFLLDWTVGGFDVFQIGRVADARRVRAAMHELAGGFGLAHDADVDLALGGGRFALRTDARGARIGAGAAEAPDRALRVVVCGDGAAMGWGLDDALTFARGLERELALDGRPVHVTNAAHLFFDFAQWPAQYAHWKAALDPAAVDLWLLCGPTVDRPPGAIQGVGAGAGQERPWWGRLLPALWELERAYGEEDAAGAPLPGDGGGVRRALAQAAAVVGSSVVVVDLGGDADLESDCGRLGVRRIDAAFSDVDLRSPMFADAAHGWPNALGHDRIRERVVSGLVELRVLAPRSAPR